MRRIFIILLGTVYLSGSFVSFIPYLYYSINKEYVALNLCENKDNLSMHCDGKCFIGNEIIKLNEQKNETKNDQQALQQNEIFPHDKTLDLDLPYFEHILLLEFNDLNHGTQLTFRSIADIPPEVLG